MVEGDFLNLISQDVASYKQAHLDCKTALKRKEEMEKEQGIAVEPPDLDFTKIIMKVINDSSINYSFSDFFKSIEKFSKNTDGFLLIVKDLITIKDLETEGKISKEGYVYFALHFYASNFNNFINFLEPLSEAIQKEKKYAYRSKSGKTKQYEGHNAETTLKILWLFEPTIEKSLERLFDRDLRNKISHEEYSLRGDEVQYENKKTKIETVFKNIAKFGLLINQLQCFDYEHRVALYEEILKKEMTEEQAKNYVKAFKTSQTADM